MSCYPLFSARICINIDLPLRLNKVLTDSEFLMMTFVRVFYLLLDWLPPKDPSFDCFIFSEMVDKANSRKMSPFSPASSSTTMVNMLCQKSVVELTSRLNYFRNFRHHLLSSRWKRVYASQISDDFFPLLMNIFALERLIGYVLTHNEKNFHGTNVWSSSRNSTI